jgi:hypothetical protein
VPLTTSEEQEITRELLAIELPTFKPVRRGAITAYDIMSPAAGAAWMRLPKNGMTVPLPSSWSMHEGQGRLLTLPYAQYVALPPGAAEGSSGQRFAGVRSRDAPDEVAGADAASAAAQDSVAGSPVAFVFTRYPKALKAPIIRGLNKPIGDLARFLVSFMVVKHGPAGLVTPRDPAASPSLDSMEGLEALDSSSSEVLQPLEPEPSAENPAVTVLASWNTVADSPSGVAGAVHVFGLEFALPLQMEEPAGVTAAAPAPQAAARGAGAAARATTTTMLSMRFNSTLLLDTSTGDIHEVTFRCPEELWDMAWEGLAEEAAEMAAEAGDDGAGRRGGVRGGGFNRALDAVARHDSDVWPGTPKATRQAAPEEPAAAASSAHVHGCEESSTQHMGRRRGRQRRRTGGAPEDAAAAGTHASPVEAREAGGDNEVSPWAGAPAGRRRRGRADRPEAGNEDIPALLRGFDVLSARQILDSATLTGEIDDTTPPPPPAPPLPVSAKPARTHRKADALR